MKYRTPCQICGSKRTIGLRFLKHSNNFLIKEVLCTSCKKITLFKIALNSGEDRYFSLSLKGKTQGLHRWVWEIYKGIFLMSDEIVHHINGHKGDNRPSNLFAMPKKIHSNSSHYGFLIDRIKELERENKCLKQKL